MNSSISISILTIHVRNGKKHWTGPVDWTGGLDWWSDWRLAENNSRFVLKINKIMLL